MGTKWNRKFLDLAHYIAKWSKDPSTQVGAVIVDCQRRVVGVGYNGFARGVDDCDYRYQHRETKYAMVVHAEANAILNSARTEGCTIYCTFCPCPACASLIIQSGIKTVYFDPSPSDERWKEQHDMAKLLFHEARVRCIQL